MNRYVLKINDSTYVSYLDWMAIEIPTIKTGSFEDALLIREWYLNEEIGHSGFARNVTRKELIKQHFPHIEFKKVKIVIDE